jgi:hypothetical protein
MNRRGAVLIICFMVILVLSILAGAFLTRSISERSVASKYFDSTQAIWLAEAGVNKAIYQLRDNYNNLTAIPATTFGPGQYSATITSNGNNRNVTASGFVPSAAAADKVQRVLVTTMIKVTPPNFAGFAIYSAGAVTIGSNCVVNGDVISGNTITGPVNGDKSPNDASLHQNGLPLLSFGQLKAISEAQGWYNPTTHVTTYPASNSFWYEAPSLSNPTGTPNVVFVEGDFTLVGGKQLVAGFIVVGGNAIYNAEIGGNASINGCLYTRGNIWLHGGGGKVINVDGALWAGGTTLMDGNEQINYDSPGHGAEYQAAIQALGINADVQITSWRETQNAY